MHSLLQSNEKAKDQELIHSSTTPYRKVINTEQNATYRRAKRSAIFQAGDHMAARHRQDNLAKTNTNKKDPQKKNRLEEIPEFNPCGPDNRHKIGPQPSYL